MSARGGLLVVMTLLTLVSCAREATPVPPRVAAVREPPVGVYDNDGRLIRGRQLPAFRVATLGGDSVSVGGPDTARLTLVNLWDTSCVPCKIEFPQLQALHDAYASRGLRIVAISNDRTDAPVHAFLMQSGAAFLIGRDPENLVMQRSRARGVPENVLVSGDGTIIWESTAILKGSGMVERIDSALAHQR